MATVSKVRVLAAIKAAKESPGKSVDLENGWKVTAAQVYPSRSMPGFAWKWSITFRAPDGKSTSFDNSWVDQKSKELAAGTLRLGY